MPLVISFLRAYAYIAEYLSFPRKNAELKEKFGMKLFR